MKCTNITNTKCKINQHHFRHVLKYLWCVSEETFRTVFHDISRLCLSNNMINVYTNSPRRILNPSSMSTYENMCDKNVRLP